jgi:mRNA-degrading endonuclease toxin of MazEF toxin-antitoxin module
VTLLRRERGAVAWALVPTVTDDGLLVLDGTSTRRVGTSALADEFCDGGRGQLVIGAMLRPVVLLQDRPQGVLGDVLALATVRVDALPAEDRERVREQAEPSLFHLPVRPQKYGLHVEVAVDLNALTRLSTSLLLPRPVGALDTNEMRVIGERLVTHLDLDLEPIIAAQVEERLTKLTGPGML